MKTRTTTVRLLAPLLASLVLAACGVKTRGPALTARQPAPDFELPDERGQRVALSQLTAKGRAVLVFYRGHW